MIMTMQDKVSKEQLILESAEQEFFIKGFDGARTTSIAKRAGVTHAMLHYYYRTKEQLFERVIDKNVSLIIATMFSSLGKADMPFLDRLKVSISSHFDIVASNPLLPHFFLNEIISRPERYNMMQNKLETSAKEIFSKVQIEIDEQSQQGNIEWIDARMLFMSIVSLNIFPFVALPFAKRMMGDLLDNQDSFLEQRKAENIETIMRRLKKQ